MNNVTHLGLDVHKQTIAVGLLRPQDPLPDYRVIDNSPESIRKLVSKLGASSPLFACYEAEIMHGSLASKSLSSLVPTRASILTHAVSRRRTQLRRERRSHSTLPGYFEPSPDLTGRHICTYDFSPGVDTPAPSWSGVPDVKPSEAFLGAFRVRAMPGLISCGHHGVCLR